MFDCVLSRSVAMFLGGKGTGNVLAKASVVANAQPVVPGSSQPPASSSKDKNKDKEALSVCFFHHLSFNIISCLVSHSCVLYSLRYHNDCYM